MNDKIIDRIKKLLAMAKDTSSPHEAAIAAKRARKLMDEYQVTELDLTSVTESDFGENDISTGRKTAGTFEGGLAIGVADLNDCQVRYARNHATGNLDLRFQGMLVDAVCATELFKYLRDEAFKQAERHADGRRNRHAYRMGFCHGVREQIRHIMKERQQLHTSTGTALVVCKQQLVRNEFGDPRYRNTNRAAHSGDSGAYRRGYTNGKRAGLNRQVDGQQQGCLTN